jgi:nucleoside-diphosphate-sugar epimerase
MQTVLITGHKGFIGRHLWKSFDRQDGPKLVGIDLKDGYDIRDCDLPDCDICFHLAALTDARSEDVLEMTETNVLGTVRILEAYGNNVVFASSSAVNYPTTGYAVSKLAGEHYCRLYGGHIVRLCNIYGTGGHGVFEHFEKDEVLIIAGDGNQLRTYAPVREAVRMLQEAPTYSPGSLNILQGEDLSVNEIASKYYGEKAVEFVERHPNDIEDGRQQCR